MSSFGSFFYTVTGFFTGTGALVLLSDTLRFDGTATLRLAVKFERPRGAMDFEFVVLCMFVSFIVNILIGFWMSIKATKFIGENYDVN